VFARQIQIMVSDKVGQSASSLLILLGHPIQAKFRSTILWLAGKVPTAMEDLRTQTECHPSK